ncbi:hypothetical protein E2562_007957 [Oryza meyeriana var. granulata]|uniref:Uncharacterized protein n=1 Tax=Oryza meyeriana var. granulata TaxID=110450 RepID=A0A6G1DFK2_9ORYZ|nr:hypothetical protein E2562_007957 [Oryza meyeriana var. granulata]
MQDQLDSGLLDGAGSPMASAPSRSRSPSMTRGAASSSRLSPSPPRSSSIVVYGVLQSLLVDGLRSQDQPPSPTADGPCARMHEHVDHTTMASRSRWRQRRIAHPPVAKGGSYDHDRVHAEGLRVQKFPADNVGEVEAVIGADVEERVVVALAEGEEEPIAVVSAKVARIYWDRQVASWVAQPGRAHEKEGPPALRGGRERAPLRRKLLLRDGRALGVADLAHAALVDEVCVAIVDEVEYVVHRRGEEIECNGDGAVLRGDWFGFSASRRGGGRG